MSQIETGLNFDEESFEENLKSPIKSSLNFTTSTPLGKQHKTWKNPKIIKKSNESFGSPSFPSPLDRIRTGKVDRGNILGVPRPLSPFSLNQSFPQVKLHYRQNEPETPNMVELKKCALEKFKGDGLNSFSFSPGHSKGSFILDNSNQAQSLSGSWAFYNYVGVDKTESNVLIQNPNKAVITIKARTSEILVANTLACNLLQLPSNQLTGQYLSNFFLIKKDKLSFFSETEFESSGRVVLISGKVMDLVNSQSIIIPVSLWIRKLSGCYEEPRCLVVIEPVERTTAWVELDKNGIILDSDDNMANLHNFSGADNLINVPITYLIPSLILPLTSDIPENLKHQTITGRTSDGVTFPLSIFLESSVPNSSNSRSSVFHATIWVFANISGLITILPDGSIHSCNNNFTLMLFGYTQEQLIGQNITTIIHSFYEDLEFLDTDSLPLPPLEEDEDDGVCGSDGPSPSDFHSTEPPRPTNPLGQFCLEDTLELLQSLTLEGTKTTLDSDINGNIDGVPLDRNPSLESIHTIPEGTYYGLGRHKDSSDLAIVYQVKRMDLDDKKPIYCLWVCRDPGEAREGSNTNEQSIQLEESDYINGPYSQHYTNLQHIGKGAFGCVKMAYSIYDDSLVITKFIRKSKVYEECWTYNEESNRRLPMEIDLLTSLKHPNIVNVLDVFENEHFFQVVMEKHGAGMDLFEFIDRAPKLDEPLASYMFRQIVAALKYLHGKNILHRDIKDENIILDQYFNVKLIDFGSAAYMGPDSYFSTFCGTMEYCSPEVLQGNKYKGPELEMWALGVTLYTLIFSENPFFDVEETMAAILKPPRHVSDELMALISWLLHPDYHVRCNLSQCEDHPWTNLPVVPEIYEFQNIITVGPEEIFSPKFYQP